MPGSVEKAAQGGGERPSERLRYAQRIHDTRDFKTVYAGKKAVQTSVVLVCFQRNWLAHSRLGVSVGVKHGNAVRRNRIKRVFRAAFRLCQHVLPSGYDYVLIPRKGVEAYSTKAVRKALEEAAGRVAKEEGGNRR